MALAVSVIDRKVLELIDAIYEAPLQPHGWTGVLNSIVQATGSAASLMGSLSTISGRCSFVASNHIDAAALSFYQDELAEKDNLNIYVNQAIEGNIIHSSRLLGDAGTKRSSVYQEWYRPREISHFIGTVISRSMSGWVALDMSRTAEQGVHGDADIAIFMRLIPHLQRAVRLSQAMDCKESVTRVSLDTMDAFRHAAIFFDGDGDVLQMNGMARAFIADSRSLRVEGGHLIGDESMHAKRLCEAIRAACRAPGAEGRSFTCQISRGPNRLPIGALVFAVNGPRRTQKPWGSADLAAILLIFDPELANSGLEQCLIDAYGLTPAEARIGSAVALRSGIGSIAARLSLGRETVRTHLKRVFHKMGVSSQAELVCLIMSDPNFNIARHALERRSQADWLS